MVKEPPVQEPLVRIATTPTCARCKIVTRDLERKGVPHEIVDVTLEDNVEFANQVRQLGYREVPVLVTTTPTPGLPAHWSGVRPDIHGRLAAIATGSTATDPVVRQTAIGTAHQLGIAS